MQSFLLVAEDFTSRSPESDDMCPEQYAFWGRNERGRYTLHTIIEL